MYLSIARLFATTGREFAQSNLGKAACSTASTILTGFIFVNETRNLVWLARLAHEDFQNALPEVKDQVRGVTRAA